MGRHDEYSEAFELVHPKDLSGESVTDFARAIGNSLDNRIAKWSQPPTVSFEVLWSPKGFVHRIRVPYIDSEYIKGQLEAHLPGIDIEPVGQLVSVPYQFGVELAMTNSMRPLRIHKAEAHARKILESMRTDEPDDEVLLQWLITHSHHHKIGEGDKVHKTPSFWQALFLGADAPKDQVKEMSVKSVEQQFSAAGLIAAKGKTEHRAQQLVMKVLRALQSENSDNRIYAKPVRNDLAKRANEADPPRSFLNVPRFRSQLTVSELASVIAWPIGDPQIPGLKQGAARRFPPTDNIARAGRVFGHSDVPGRKHRPVALEHKDALLHQIVVGASGSGKSTLLCNTATQDIAAGHGLVLIDAGTDVSPERLYSRVLESLPPHRLNDVIAVGLSDSSDYPVGINLLDQGFGLGMIDQIVAVFETLYPAIKTGVSVRELLHHGLWTLIEHGGYTVIDLASLINPRTATERAWASEMIKGVKDPELKDFWDRHSGALAKPDSKEALDWARYIQPLQNRLWQLAGRPEIRHVLGQTHSTINLKQVLMENKVLLISLGGLPQDSAELFGTLISNTLWAAAQAVLPVKSNFLYLDEFQVTSNIQGGMSDILARARARKLGLVMATQFLSSKSIDPELQGAVINNTGTKVVLKVSAQEAAIWTRELGNRLVQDTDITKLRRYHGIAQIANSAGDSTPVTFKSLLPTPPTGVAKRALQLSRDKYAKNVTEVRKEITARRSPKSTAIPKEAPKIGWD